MRNARALVWTKLSEVFADDRAGYLYDQHGTPVAVVRACATVTRGRDYVTLTADVIDATAFVCALHTPPRA